jgi:SAM-dependent methyltransferase
VDIRTSNSRAVQAAGRALARLNRRHPWSHNDHFHGWILRRLPDRRGAALDIGSGRGLLARRLASRFQQVTAIDVDSEMADATASRCADLVNVTVRRCPVEEIDGQEVFDLVTMVAVLHHVDPTATLAAVRRLLRPGGRLLVVGLARVDGVVDTAWDVASALTNPLIGMALHPRPARDAGGDRPPEFPVRDPVLSVRELRSVLRQEVPGARLRRRLGFRHTIEWTKPG